MAKRKTLSDLTKPRDLEAVFDCTYETRVRVSSKMPSLRGLRPVLLGEMDEGTWGEVCRRYTAFFTEGTAGVQRRERMEVKGPLGRIFDFLHSIATGPQPTNDFFANGAGKLFMYELLTMCSQRNYRVAVSTTNHPRNDWCGITSPL